MLTTRAKVQLAIFFVASIVAVLYTAVTYAGIPSPFGSKKCTISVQLTDSGGIFSGAEVAYRGVTVGSVGGLHPNPQGVLVDLNLKSCSSPQIP